MNGVIIEKATSGSGDDTFYQIDTVANILDGQSGNDKVYYSNVSSHYTIEDVSGDGLHVTVTSGSVTDVLYNIEQLVFSNKTINTNNIGTYSECQWIFLLNSNNDIVGIRTNGGTGTELHVLTNSSNYQTLNVIQTALYSTDTTNWSFAFDNNNHLFCIFKGPTTGSGQTEIHVLQAPSYQTFLQHIATALHLTNEYWQFQLDTNKHLFCILRGPSTGSNRTEVHVLNASNNYQSFLNHNATALYITDYNWIFQLDNQNNLFCIHKGPTNGSNTTEIHVLNASTNYKTFSLQVPTVLYMTTSDVPIGMNWHHILDSTNHVYSILSGPSSGSNKIELHAMNSANYYASFLKQLATTLDIVCN